MATEAEVVVWDVGEDPVKNSGHQGGGEEGRRGRRREKEGRKREKDEGGRGRGEEGRKRGEDRKKGRRRREKEGKKRGGEEVFNIPRIDANDEEQEVWWCQDLSSVSWVPRSLRSQDPAHACLQTGSEGDLANRKAEPSLRYCPLLEPRLQLTCSLTCPEAARRRSPHLSELLVSSLVTLLEKKVLKT